MTGARDRQSGFTLVEVLIAMFIFALITAGTITALTGSLRGKAQMNERLEALSRIETARALMKSDFANIRLLPVRDAYGGKAPYLLSGGIDNLVSFTRGGRNNPGGLETRSEFQRVTYIFEDGNLIRRALSHADPAPQTGTVDRVLLGGLADVAVKYYVGSPQSASSGAQTASFNSRFFTRDHILVADAKQSDVPRIITFEARFNNGDTLVQHFELAL